MTCFTGPECFYVGGTVELKAVFTENGIPVDPTYVTLTVVDSEGEQIIFPTRDSAGRYSALFQPRVPFAHVFRFEGVGGFDQVSEGRFSVRPQS